MSFDVIKYLDSRRVQHSTGKNVKAGNVGIQCFNPFCDDHSNHLGISLSTGQYSCWKCGTKGGAAKLVMTIDKCGYTEAVDILQQFGHGPVLHTKRPELGTFMLPKFSDSEPHRIHLSYLEARGYNWRELVEQYSIRFTGPVAYVDTPTGRTHYRWRIIIPIFIDGAIVNFTSRDVTGRDAVKYKACPDNIAMTPGSDVVYNLDNAGSRMALVEGPFDAWRIGPGAVAMLGTKFTEERLALVASKRPSRVYVVYDSDASDIAEELGTRMARLVPRVDYLWLDKGCDPDTMSLSDIRRLQQMLGVGNF